MVCSASVHCARYILQFALCSVAQMTVCSAYTHCSRSVCSVAQMTRVCCQMRSAVTSLKWPVSRGELSHHSDADEPRRCYVLFLLYSSMIIVPIHEFSNKLFSINLQYLTSIICVQYFLWKNVKAVVMNYHVIAVDHGCAQTRVVSQFVSVC